MLSPFDQGIVVKSLLGRIRRHGLIVLGIFCLGQASSPAIAVEPSVTSALAESSKRLATARLEKDRSTDIPSRIRATTWQLLVGELAGDRSIGMSSGSFDEFTNGLKALDQIVAELKEQPQVERELTKHLQLTMRFDAVRARRALMEKQRDVSRSDELLRLSQLREINRAYRDLVQNLMRLQTSTALGQATEAAKFGDDATKLMTGIEKVVGQRRDFYLFQDEPALGAEENEELKLVRELAQPLAGDVRRHQLALQAYTLAQLAQPTTSASLEKLKAAQSLAAESLADSTEPHVLGHWALAIACRELGRLETLDSPWDRNAHERAAESFERARQALSTARSHIPAEAKDAIFVVEVDRQLAELTSPLAAIESAMTRLAAGQASEAIAIVERCASLHRTPQVAIAFTDCKRLGGATLEEMDQLTHRLWESLLLQDDNDVARLVRGRQVILGLWRQFSDERPVNRNADWHRDFTMQLDRALSDLAFAVKSDNSQTRRIAECHRALAAAIQLLLSPTANPEFARIQLAGVPLAVAELEQDLDGAPLIEKLMRREAVIAGRLAHGYLALRLLPDYQSTAPRAFASAVDAFAQAPAGLTLPRVLGVPVLQSLSGRADGADARMAQEEQQVRRALQRLLPAVAAMQLSPSVATASNLRDIARDLETAGGGLGPRSALDPRETGDARTTAAGEVRMAAVLAFLAANEPAAAMREALLSWRAGLTEADLTRLDANSLRENLLSESDPIRKSITALALEEYAALTMTTADNQSPRAWLTLAKDLQTNAFKQFADSSLLARTHAGEVEMNRRAVERLADPQYYLAQSRTLVSELRLNDARLLLDAGLRRHPDSILLRESLAQTLIDEADLRPTQSGELIGRAIEQLEALTSDPARDTSGSLLKLAGLLERTKDEVRAKPLYLQVADRATDPRQKLLARSRLAVLQARTEAP